MHVIRLAVWTSLFLCHPAAVALTITATLLFLYFFAISLLFDILHKLCFNNFLLNDDEDEDDDDDDGTTDQPWSVL